MNAVKIIECPRDAVQGLKNPIPARAKAAYINYLLSTRCFDTVDFGSFVSPVYMPQMADTEEVLQYIEPVADTGLLAILANMRGAEQAVRQEKIDYLGFPFSVSETFQQRNTHASVEVAYDRVKQISELCFKAGKELVIYLSMGFGNPYGDPWSPEIIMEWTEKISRYGVRIFSVSDTVGLADEASTGFVTGELLKAFPSLEVGVHLHTRPEAWEGKIQAAFNAGCRRFDGAMLGYGGCPMAADELTGNMPTERLLEFFGLAAGEEINRMKEAFASMIASTQRV